MTIDAGTGDGRAVLAAATRDPANLVLGLDANAASMAEASRRAARPARKGGLPNAAFVVAAAEALPTELCGVADLVTVRLPWGSLLRGVVGREEVVATGLAGLVTATGTIELLLAPIDRDSLGAIPTSRRGLVDGAAAAFEPRGFEIDAVCELTPAQLRDSGSSWARRLGRPATLIRLRRR